MTPLPYLARMGRRKKIIARPIRDPFILSRLPADLVDFLRRPRHYEEILKRKRFEAKPSKCRIPYCTGRAVHRHKRLCAAHRWSKLHLGAADPGARRDNLEEQAAERMAELFGEAPE